LKRILWCITGAGGQLRSVFQSLLSLKESCSELEVGVAFSKAGVEVARVYGILDKVSSVATGGRYGGVYWDASSSGITEDGVPLGGRISLGRYDVVVVAPATSNTVAKIAHGIADTLPTIAASQALKSGTPLLILPADYAEESVTTLPCRIIDERCIRCLLCVDACPYDAIRVSPGGEVRIDYGVCRGCVRCEAACPVEAIRCWERSTVNPSSIDLENVAKLKMTRGVHIASSSGELIRKLRSLLGV
jgi:dihydromethanopterin reductase (acceptor)